MKRLGTQLLLMEITDRYIRDLLPTNAPVKLLRRFIIIITLNERCGLRFGYPFFAARMNRKCGFFVKRS